MSRKKKENLYEYQYTTPNKKVVKETLPAIRKPSGMGKYKAKIFWGGLFGICGACKLLGTLEILSYADKYIGDGKTKGGTIGGKGFGLKMAGQKAGAY